MGKLWRPVLGVALLASAGLLEVYQKTAGLSSVGNALLVLVALAAGGGGAHFLIEAIGPSCVRLSPGRKLYMGTGLWGLAFALSLFREFGGPAWRSLVTILLPVLWLPGLFYLMVGVLSSGRRVHQVVGYLTLIPCLVFLAMVLILVGVAISEREWPSWVTLIPALGAVSFGAMTRFLLHRSRELP